MSEITTPNNSAKWSPAPRQLQSPPTIPCESTEEDSLTDVTDLKKPAVPTTNSPPLFDDSGASSPSARDMVDTGDKQPQDYKLPGASASDTMHHEPSTPSKRNTADSMKNQIMSIFPDAPEFVVEAMMREEYCLLYTRIDEIKNPQGPKCTSLPDSAGTTRDETEQVNMDAPDANHLAKTKAAEDNDVTNIVEKTTEDIDARLNQKVNQSTASSSLAKLIPAKLPQNPRAAPNVASVAQSVVKRPAVPSKKRKSAPPANRNYVRNGYTDNDVLKGRGGRSNNHPGNERFLKLKRAMQPRYKAATKDQKGVISQELVDAVHGWGGRFLELDEQAKMWYEVDNETARRKASQTLRERNDPEYYEAKRAKYSKKR